MKRALLIALVGPAALCAAPLTYFQDWFPGPQFAGLYVAIDRGFYTDAGLTLSVHPFAFGENAPAMMDTDGSQAAVGTMEGYILLQKRARGADLRVFTAVLRESPAGYMALPGTPLRSARDFIGRRVGVHKYGDPLYRLFLARAGIDPSRVSMVFVDDDVGRLVRGEVDVMQGYAIEEWVKLRRRVGPSAPFLSFKELGFDAYSQVVFSTAPQARAHRPEIAAFIRATRRGWVYALAHPGEAVAAVAARMKPPVDRALLGEMLEAERALVSPGAEEPLGSMDAGKWRALSAACVQMALVARPEDPGVFLEAPVP